MDQVISLSSLTKLMMPAPCSVLDPAGMLDALRQLSGLQSLQCQDNVMQGLLVNSVPRSWSLLTELRLFHGQDAPDPLDWSLVKQQCPQLQALSIDTAVPLCLMALTSLTCLFWSPPDRDSIQCSRLVELHVFWRANLDLLTSTLTSLSLDDVYAWREPSPSVANIADDHLRSLQSLGHMCFDSYVLKPSDIGNLLPASHPALSSVTSVKLNAHPQVFFPPDMNASMAGEQFHHFGAWFPHLQRVHIHLSMHCRQPEEAVLISAAWLPAHCRLVVTHQLTCPVRIVKCPSGCLSLPLSSRTVDG